MDEWKLLMFRGTTAESDLERMNGKNLPVISKTREDVVRRDGVRE